VGKRGVGKREESVGTAGGANLETTDSEEEKKGKESHAIPCGRGWSRMKELGDIPFYYFIRESPRKQDPRNGKKASGRRKADAPWKSKREGTANHEPKKNRGAHSDGKLGGGS